MFCSKCGSNISEGAAFCKKCGSPVAAKPAAAPAPTPNSAPAPSAFPTSANAHVAAPAAGAATVAHKGVSKRVVAIGLAVIVIAAGVVAACMLTNCFGLGAKPVYVCTKQTDYFNGEKNVIYNYKYDGAGSLKSASIDAYIDGQAKPVSEYEYENDKDGNLEKGTGAGRSYSGDKAIDEHEDEFENDNEFDQSGALVKRSVTTTRTAKGSDSETTIENTVEYAYHSNGRIKSYESTNDSTNILREFDDRGYILHSETTYKTTEAANRGMTDSRSDFEWEFDSSGKPKGYTVTTVQTDKAGDETKTNYSNTVDTDDAGNITAVYNEDGDKVTEFKWERIDRPCRAAQDRSIRLGQYL